ncbi:MAG: hypothetical protein ACE14S_06155 [Candidatus Bathyarchaeia archaeon]
MKTEKKLIACSVIAIMIGVASIAPLLFLMSGTAKAETTPKPWFNVDVPYAYIEAGDGSLMSSFDFPGSTMPRVNESDMDYERSMIFLNISMNTDLKSELDDRSEYYLIEVDSDKGPIENVTQCFGTYGIYFQPSDYAPDGFHFNRDNWFDSNTTTQGLWLLHNYTYTSMLWPEGHSGWGTKGHSSTSRTAAAIKEADTIYITVRRLGWVTFSGNLTVVTRSYETLARIQLDRYGNGFLYNAIIPMDKLSEIDLNAPLTLDPQTGQYVLK